MSNIVERLDEIIAKNVALEIGGMSEAIKAHYRAAFCAEAASEITRLQAELSKMTAWRKEEFERAERMAEDWAEFCKALDLEWGDQQHAVNQIVANFNKAAKEARAEALEKAAKVCEANADKWIRMAANPAVTKDIRWDDPQEARSTMMEYARCCQSDANSIRALPAIRRLKEGATPEPVPSLAKLFDDMAAKQHSINNQFDEFMSDVEDKP